MVSIASDDLPEPLGPLNTVISFRGMRTDTSFRLCWRAPCTSRWVISSWGLEFGVWGLADRPLSFFFGNRIGARAAAVCEVGCLATASGVPAVTTCPPPLPPSGPMSISQSAVFITSRLCSITTTVLPSSTNPCSTSSSLRMSSKCSPVVGSSRMYRDLPVALRTSSLASLTRWASPPLRVGEGWPSLM